MSERWLWPFELTLGTGAAGRRVCRKPTGVIGSRMSDNSAALPTGGDHQKNGSIALKLSLNSTKINATDPTAISPVQAEAGNLPQEKSEYTCEGREVRVTQCEMRYAPRVAYVN